MLDRNPQGRFVQGNKASPGRPRRITENQYLGRLTELLTADKWDQIVNRAIKDAIKGSATARQWLSDYVIGKPPQILELRATDAVVLKQVINELAVRGISAGDVFETMLQELQQADLIQNDNP